MLRTELRAASGRADAVLPARMSATISNGSASPVKKYKHTCTYSSTDEGTAASAKEPVVITESSSRSADLSSSAATAPTPTVTTQQRTIFSRSRAFFLILVLALTALHTGETFHNVRSLSESLPFAASYFYMTTPINHVAHNSTQPPVAAAAGTNKSLFADIESSPGANATITTGATKPTTSANETSGQQRHNPPHWEPALRMPPLPPPLVRNATGGLVFFLHIPKTGGTTVRDLFKQHADQFYMARHVGRWNKMVSTVDRLVKEGTKGQIVALETHDQNVPPYHKLSPKIREWKRTAGHNHVPFFVATVLRESVSMQISSFNYYYVAPWKKLANDTVPDFLDTLLYNPQCSFLHQGGMFFENLDRKHPFIRERRDKLNRELEKSQCDRVYQLLLEDMDWVGTTERMSLETLPLFHYLFQLRNVTSKHSNKMRVRMHQDRLKQTDLEFVKNTTMWDQEWYRKTQEIYQFDQWSDQIRPEFFFSRRRR